MNYESKKYRSVFFTYKMCLIFVNDSTLLCFMINYKYKRSGAEVFVLREPML